MNKEVHGDFHHTVLEGGTRVFVHTTDKFKTTAMRWIQLGTLDEAAGRRALISAVLRRGTVRHPTMMDLTRALDSLYGVSLTFDVAKIGSRQALSWTMGLLSPKWVQGDQPLLQQTLSLFRELLLEPRTEEGVFVREFVEQERVNLVRYIESVVDDKMSLAAQRLLQEMYEGQPYGRYEWGSVEELASVSADELMRLYEQTVVSPPGVFIAVGPLTVEDVVHAIEGFPGDGRELQLSMPPPPLPPQSPLRMVLEEQEVSQAKMAIGAHVDMGGIDSRGGASLGLMNCLLGGGMHSKLFKEVREKESLAYYVSSSIDRYQGALFIHGGIESANFEKARDLSLKQIDAIAGGDFSSEAFEASRSTLIDRLRGLKDSPGALIDFLVSNLFRGEERTLEDAIENLGSLNEDDVAAAAARIRPDTVYLLKEMA